MKRFVTWKLTTTAILIGLILGLAYWGFGNVKNAQGLERNTLAVVNTTQITKQDFEEQWKQMPQEMQNAFKEDRGGFLKNLVITEMLYQEAKRIGISAVGDSPGQGKQQAIREMLQQVTAQVKVTDDEIRRFYDENPEQVKSLKYEDIKDSIKDYLLSQKQDEVVNKLIEEVKARTTVVQNQDWLKKQGDSKTDNPFSKVVHNGRPTVLDLGSNTCVPCKMMKPILDELEQEYKNKVNVVVLELGDYRDLARQHRIRVIPTQIFFDKDGNEYWRHEGFLAKEDIQTKLRELGAE